MNEQKEGKPDQSENNTSHKEGLSAVSVTEDSQIANIEEQLKKAQETLGDLQALKIKIEQDRQAKQLEAKKQAELLDAVKVNEENIKLKDELKNYQGEIGSLKDMISSLKDDLVASTEQLQKKVVSSLKILEEADASLKKGHFESKPVPIIVKFEAPIELAPVVEAPAEPTPIQAAPVAPLPTPPSQLPALAEDITIEDELDEYKRIKDELNAMESGDVTVEESEISNQMPASAVAPAPTPTIEPIQTAKTLIVDKNNINIPVIVTSKEEKSAVSEIVKEEKKKGFLFFRKNVKSDSKPEKEKKEEKPEPKESPKTEEKPKDEKEPDKKRKLIRFFKKKDKKSKNNDDKPSAKADTASGGLLIKTAVLLIVLFAGGVAYQINNADKTRKIYIDQVQGQVKGAADSQSGLGGAKSSASTNPEDRYKEAFVDEPFANSIWMPFVEPDYGIKIEYSKNTSNLYQPLGSTSIWFLRKNGYLMKIDKTTSDLSLEQFIATQKSSIDYSSEAVMLKGFPAIHLIQREYMEVTGNTYFVKAGGDIYKVWYKTYTPGENTDDEQRVKKMLDTLEFTKSKPPVVKIKKTK